MRAIWIRKWGGPEVLEVREAPDPRPSAGQVRVRVRAAGLNFAEVMARQGLYPDAPKAPCVMGYEAAGVVDAVGDGVTTRAVGDRVAVLTRFGAHADCIVAPAENTFAIPELMTFEQAAALPVVYLTAWHMIFRVAAVRPGETVLVHMAAGGVGTAALQLCRTISDVTVIGTASASKHDFIRSMGCTHAIDYRTTDYAREVRRITGGRGVDVVLDALGGHDWRKGAKLLAPVGRLVAYGFANALSGRRRNLLALLAQGLRVPLFNPITLMNRNITVAGVNMGHLWDQIPMLTEEMGALLALFDRGAIAPVIDSVFTFEKAASAHARIESRANVGKVVLVP